MVVAFVSIKVGDLTCVAGLFGETDGKIQGDIFIQGSVVQFQRSGKIGEIRIGRDRIPENWIIFGCAICFDPSCAPAAPA